MITSRDKTYAAAQKFQQKGQLDKAIVELERLVQEDPTDVRTLLKIGDLHVRRQDTPAAIATYTQVAQAYRDEGFFLKAVAVYKQVVHLDPANMASAQDLAALYEQLGLVSDAVQQYRTLLALHQEHAAWPEAIVLLHKLRALEGDTQDLLLQWADAHTHIDDVPEVKRTLTRVAEACRAQGREADWAHVAEELLNVDPDLAGLACELARYYMGRDEPKQALLKLQLAFRAAPQDTETLTLLAQVFEALGQAPKAIAVLHELAAQAQQRGQTLALERIAAHILKLDPDDGQARGYTASAPAVLSERARNPGPQGDNLPALPKATAPAQAPTIDLTNLLIEASVFARYGLRARALEYLDRVLVAFPDHAGARAQADSLRAHMQPAIAASQASVNLDSLIAEVLPDGQIAAGTSGLDHHFDTYLMHAQEGLPLMAPAPAQQVAASDFETHFNLGIAYREMGLYDDAIGQFEKAQASDAYAVNAGTMMGLCLFDLERYDAGTRIMQATLELPQTTAQQRVALLYELGIHAQAAGHEDVAEGHFSRAYALDPNFRDVAQRARPRAT